MYKISVTNSKINRYNTQNGHSNLPQRQYRGVFHGPANKRPATGLESRSVDKGKPYLTEKMWSQLLTQYTNIKWLAIPRDPIIDFCMTGILAFFFGFRQRAKEKSVQNFQ